MGLEFFMLQEKVKIKYVKAYFKVNLSQWTQFEIFLRFCVNWEIINSNMKSADDISLPVVDGRVKRGRKLQAACDTADKRPRGLIFSGTVHSVRYTPETRSTLFTVLKARRRQRDANLEPVHQRAGRHGRRLWHSQGRNQSCR